MKMTTLYQLTQQSHIQMMSYVLQTRDGTLAVIDGGETEDAGYLLSVLKYLAGKKPRVSAWFLTHPHSDHINAIMELFRHYRDEIDIDKIYCHFPTPEFVNEYEHGAYHAIAEFEELKPSFEDRITIVKEGDIITVGLEESSVTFEVLYTTDPVFCSQDVVNNTSTVFRMEADGCTVLFLGDLAVGSGEKLLTQCPDKLKSDIVQMAHHGQNGVGFSVYEKISPQLSMWCTPLWLWENNQGKRGYNSGPWKIFEVRRWMEMLGVQQHIVAKDGTYAITLSKSGFSVKQITEKNTPLYADPAQ